MRKPFLAGNWKMNTNVAGSLDLVSRIVRTLDDITTVDIAVCPPFVYLLSVARTLSSSNVSLGAQNVYFEGNGAFTGEISCRMLKDVCCTYVIIGHSERRHVMGETDEVINKKINAAISGGLLPIFCVGELLEQRQAGQTEEVVSAQIKKGLSGISTEKVEAVTIAYEPVWAIGTGKTASAKQAQEVHEMIRGLIARMYDETIANTIRIQYGGSANPANTVELMICPDVDGLLVGGASLKPNDFAAMVRTVAEMK